MVSEDSVALQKAELPNGSCSTWLHEADVLFSHAHLLVSKWWRIRKLLYNNVTSEVTGSVFVLESCQATCENCEHRWYFCVYLDAQVWSEVNQAVLDYENRESTPKLAKLLKLLLWAQNELDQKKVKYPKMTDLSSGTIEDPKWTATFHVPLIYDQSVTVWRQVTCINKCYIVFFFHLSFTRGTTRRFVQTVNCCICKLTEMLILDL